MASHVREITSSAAQAKQLAGELNASSDKQDHGLGQLTAVAGRSAPARRVLTGRSQALRGVAPQLYQDGGSG